jgi:hypothetical protein
MSGPSQVAADVVAGLKAQPALLAIIVLNLIVLGLAAWFLKGLVDVGKERQAQMMQIIDRCTQRDGAAAPLTIK